MCIKDPKAFCRYPVIIHKRRIHMTHRAKDEEREERITMEIIVDAYDSEEQAMGWYYYLEGTLHFPLIAAICHSSSSSSYLAIASLVIMAYTTWALAHSPAFAYSSPFSHYRLISFAI